MSRRFYVSLAMVFGATMIASPARSQSDPVHVQFLAIAQRPRCDTAVQDKRSILLSRHQCENIGCINTSDTPISRAVS